VKLLVGHVLKVSANDFSAIARMERLDGYGLESGILSDEAWHIGGFVDRVLDIYQSSV
jgi:hypothetical protein